MSITLDLEQKSKAAPDKDFEVIITLKRDAQDLQPRTLGTVSVQPYEGLPGICHATVTGKQALELAKLSDIEKIEESEEQNALG